MASGPWRLRAGAFAVGMLAGLVWEYLRETHIRREARQRSAEVARLENEVGGLRHRHAAPRDEVLAILDRLAARLGLVCLPD